MFNWYIFMLILLGFLQTPEEWNTLTPQQQTNYIIILDDYPQ